MAVAQTILGISLLIILHELGHYLVARACNMRVLRFSVGFGPTLFKRTFGETTWQVAAIPLGGFVQVDGMGPREADVYPDDERNYRNRPRWQRAAVIAAGPAMNWVLAALFIGALALTVGFSRIDESRAEIGDLVEGEAAAQAGLAPGDVVLSINGEPTKDWNELVAHVRAHPEEPLTFAIERGGERMAVTVTPKRSGEGGFGVLGVYPPTVRQRTGPLGAVALGFTGAWNMTARQVGLLWGMVAGTEEGRLSGLPGMIKMVSEQARRGIERLLQSLAWLSITLCILNLLPIPALDGSRLVFIGVEAVRGKPIDERVESVVHTIGFALLLALMIAVSVRDLL